MQSCIKYGSMLHVMTRNKFSPSQLNHTRLYKCNISAYTPVAVGTHNIINTTQHTMWIVHTQIKRSSLPYGSVPHTLPPLNKRDRLSLWGVRSPTPPPDGPTDAHTNSHNHQIQTCSRAHYGAKDHPEAGSLAVFVAATRVSVLLFSMESLILCQQLLGQLCVDIGVVLEGYIPYSGVWVILVFGLRKFAKCHLIEKFSYSLVPRYPTHYVERMGHQAQD